NPNLLPEESRGYDFGFEQSLFQDRLKFGATWFHNDIKNLISFGPPPNYPNINVNRAETHGVEVFAAAQLTDRLTLRTDYTRTVAVNSVTGDPLARRPAHKTGLTAIWQPTDALTLSA